MSIVNSEIKDSIGKCFIGRICSIINCLNGFYEDIQIAISSSDQIGNVIIITRKALISSKGEYNIEEHKKLASDELRERGYSDSVISEWINFIE